MMEFIKGYNEKTAAQAGSIVPVEITIYDDRSFTYILNTPPAADLLKKVVRRLKRDRGTPNKMKVAKIRKSSSAQIAQTRRCPTSMPTTLKRR